VDDRSPNVTLVLKPEVRVKGRVITDSGPVIGARIVALPRETKAITAPTGVTNEAGLFSIGLPPGTKTYDLLVTGFGFAATLGRAYYLGERKIVTVGVERQGGRLVLRVPSKSAARLVHEGAEWAVNWVATETHGTVEPSGVVDVVTLPEVEHGNYQLCVGSRCTSGTLAIGGSLTLALD